MCKRNRDHTFRRGNNSSTYKPDCRCWKCRECRPRLKRRWIEHARRKFLKWEEDGGYLGYATVAGDETFQAMVRRFRRRKMPYFRIRTGNDGQYAVLFGYRSEDDLSFSCDEQCLTADAAGGNRPVPQHTPGRVHCAVESLSMKSVTLTRSFGCGWAGRIALRWSSDREVAGMAKNRVCYWEINGTVAPQPGPSQVTVRAHNQAMTCLPLRLG